MIIVKLMGGLGNQMFQYAAARQLSLLRNTSLKTDLSFLKTDSKGAYTTRTYGLNVFAVPDAFASESDVRSYLKIKSGLRKSLYKILPFLSKRKYFKEQGHAFNKDVLQCPSSTYLEGFWQSEKYFEKFAEQIRKDFSFKTEPRGANAVLVSEIISHPSVSMHVRRTDYLANEKVLQYHGVCSLDYYNKAVELIAGKVPGIYLYVFSDDVEWAKENFKWEFPVKFISHNEGDKSFEDMRLMSLCKHNVIANSSFSWWGAWLNNNPEKIVVAPEQWFGDRSIDTSDVIPSKWIKL